MRRTLMNLPIFILFILLAAPVYAEHPGPADQACMQPTGTGTDAKLEKAHALGADEVVNHTRQSIADEVKRLTDKRGVAAVKGYLEYVAAETRRRYDAGMGLFEAAQDISLTDYSSWGDAERIVLNVAALYREFSGGKRPEGPSPDLFGMMAELRASRRR